MVTIVFLVAAGLAVLFSILAIAHRSPVINVLSLVMVFFALAAIFAVLGMDFLAAIQLIVYSGAILVLFLFVIMLLNINRVERLGSGRPLQAVLGAIAAIGVGAITIYGVSKLAPAKGAVLADAGQGTVFPIGKALVGSHLFPFEFISVVLVAAIVGAVYLAKRESAS
ncbi:MAG: NADH-quinone oxidoreductase subunit J [bacterium]|nr:NADH-quinone oxidoreductase subunit J [bacterium]